MRKTKARRLGATPRTTMRVGATVAAATAMLASAASPAPASVPVDLRVVSNATGNLADVRQYVPTTTTVDTLAGDDCFDPTPPIKQSSGRSYTQPAPTMLGAIWEAAKLKPMLQPVRISDADYASFNALSVCQINGKTPPGFFLLKSNHVGLTVGADLFFLQGDEDLLVYRTPPDFSADEELELTAPVRTTPGVPVLVNVRAYTGSLATRAGALVLGGEVPTVTNASGNAFVTFSGEGERQLIAYGDYNDIPSAYVSVCVHPEPLAECSAARGREILGSDEPEQITGTDGDDEISPRAGRDRIKARDGDDTIVANGGGRDRINCGGGKDVVKRSTGDRVAKNCEKVKGKTKGGKNGGRKKGKGK